MYHDVSGAQLDSRVPKLDFNTLFQVKGPMMHQDKENISTQKPSKSQHGEMVAKKIFKQLKGKLKTNIVWHVLAGQVASLLDLLQKINGCSDFLRLQYTNTDSANEIGIPNLVRKAFQTNSFHFTMLLIMSFFLRESEAQVT